MNNLNTTALAAQDVANDPDTLKQAFLSDVVSGLSQSPKVLEPKYFYDERGSQLFDRICALEEYYPTRTELRILSDHAKELADIIGTHAHLVEFGSGSSTKVRILLDALEGLASYVPVDISADHLLDAAKSLANDYPDISIIPVCADFTEPFSLPAETETGQRVGFFPGSTIGNFQPDAAVGFLQTAAQSLGPGGTLIIGVDLKKDESTLLAAYNDASGVTAEFNLNVLKRINAELGANFDLAAFDHEAIYNSEAGRIEMHLLAKKPQTVTVNGHQFDFEQGESIHTENSYKYSVDEFYALADTAGYEPVQTWTDPNGLFSLHYLRVTG